MSWTEKLPSGKYRGGYRDRGGAKQYLKGTFTQSAEALRQAAIVEDKQRQRGAVNVRDGKVTVEQFVNEYWHKRKVEPGTLGKDESRLKRHILPYWALTEVGEIDRDQVQDWVDSLSKWMDEDRTPHLAPATVHRIYAVFSALMKAAVLGRKIVSSPCVSIELPVIPPGDEYYMEREEFARFRDAAPTFGDRVLLDVKVNTGMRWGEIAALHRKRVHRNERRIEVVEVYDAHTKEIKPYPKGRRKRSVPLTDELAELLEKWFREGPRMSCQTPHRQVRGRHGNCESELVFPNSTGGVLNYSNFKRDVWNPTLKAAGLSGATPHDLRHTYASWILQDGNSLETVAKLLGHSSASVTERYGHLADTQWDAVRIALTGQPREDETTARTDTTAPYLPHEDDNPAGAKIINLASRRRSAG